MDVQTSPADLFIFFSFNAPLAYHQQAAAIRMMCACARLSAFAM